MCKTVERSGEVINRVVRNRQGAVAALIANYEAEIENVFFADLKIVRYFLAVRRLAPSTFVERELSVDQIAMILKQPVDAVVGTTAFLVGGERDDDVAIRLEAFTLVANEVGDPDRCLRFVVASAATIEDNRPSR